MACLQGTAIGTEIVIECDPTWDCCQRKQAAQKVRQQNDLLRGDSKLGRTSAQMKKLFNSKQKYCRNTRAPYKKLKGKKEKLAQKCEDNGAHPCLVKKIRDGDQKLDEVQLDHTLEVKAGGAVKAPLVPLDAKVNGAFGNMLKNIVDQMPKPKEIEKMSLICPPSKPGCPRGKPNSVGRRKNFPSDAPFVTPKSA